MNLAYPALIKMEPAPEGTPETFELVFPDLPGCTITHLSFAYSMAEIVEIAHTAMQNYLEQLIEKGLSLLFTSQVSLSSNMIGNPVIGAIIVPLRHEALLDRILGRTDGGV